MTYKHLQPRVQHVWRHITSFWWNRREIQMKVAWHNMWKIKFEMPIEESRIKSLNEMCSGMIFWAGIIICHCGNGCIVVRHKMERKKVQKVKRNIKSWNCWKLRLRCVRITFLLQHQIIGRVERFLRYLSFILTSNRNWI